jgi:hypothetical protein
LFFGGVVFLSFFFSKITTFFIDLFSAYEYVPDSEVATSLMTGLSISEDDLLDKDALDRIEEFSAPCFIIPLDDTAPLELGKPKK